MLAVFPVLTALWLMEASAKGPAALSVRDISPSTPQAVGEAARERMIKPMVVPRPDRIMEFGFGFGFPYLVAGEMSFQVLKHFQFGGTYGILPGGSAIVPVVHLPKQTQILRDGLSYTLQPNITTTLDILCPFIRYFPTERMFYLQLTWALLRSKHTIVSAVTPSFDNIAIPGASITAVVSLLTQLPTLSVGYFFWRSMFFANINLGATFLLSTSSSVVFKINLPASIGGVPPSVEAGFATHIDTALNNGIAQVRKTAAILPSIMFATGLMF